MITEMPQAAEIPVDDDEGIEITRVTLRFSDGTVLVDLPGEDKIEIKFADGKQESYKVGDDTLTPTPTEEAEVYLDGFFDYISSDEEEEDEG